MVSSFIGGFAKQQIKEADEKRQAELQAARDQALAELNLQNSMKLFEFQSGIERAMAAEKLKEDIAREEARIITAQTNFSSTTPIDPEVVRIGTGGGGTNRSVVSNETDPYKYSVRPYPVEERSREIRAQSYVNGIPNSATFAKLMAADKKAWQSQEIMLVRRGQSQSKLTEWGVPKEQLDRYIDENGMINDKGFEWKSGYDTTITKYGPRFAVENYNGDSANADDIAKAKGVVAGTWDEREGFRYAVDATSNKQAKDTIAQTFGGAPDENGIMYYKGQLETPGIGAFSNSIYNLTTAIAESTPLTSDSKDIAIQFTNGLNRTGKRLQKGPLVEQDVFSVNPETGQTSYTPIGQELVTLLSTASQNIVNSSTASAYEGVVNTLRQIAPERVTTPLIDSSDKVLLDRIMLGQKAGVDLTRTLGRETLLRMKAAAIESKKVTETLLETPVEVEVQTPVEVSESVPKERIVDRYKPTEVGKRILDFLDIKIGDEAKEANIENRKEITANILGGELNEVQRAALVEENKPDAQAALTEALQGVSIEQIDEAANTISGMTAEELLKVLQEDTLPPEEDFALTVALTEALMKLKEER